MDSSRAIYFEDTVFFNAWRRAQRLTPLWLLCGRPVGATNIRRYYFSNLPAHTSLARVCGGSARGPGAASTGCTARRHDASTRPWFP